DFNEPLTPDTVKTMALKMFIHSPSLYEADMLFEAQSKLTFTLRPISQNSADEISLLGAYQKIVEFYIPVSQINNPDKKEFEITLIVLKDGVEQERWPSDSTLKIPFPNKEIFVENWQL